MKKRVILLALAVLLVMLTFTGCMGGVGKNENTRKITISIQENAVLGESVKLEKEANFSSFYHDKINYQFVGENTCGATFSHVLDNKNNWYDTYVEAERPGSVDIKLTYVENGKVTAESNVVTITFIANTISTVEELKALAGSDGSYALGADIDLSSEGSWKPIEGFTGALYGNGHKIFNLTINEVNKENMGLFGTLEGTVSDLTLENVQISLKGDAGKAGIVAGTNKGKIKNVTVEGNILAEYYNNVGGIAGYNDNGTVLNCTNRANIIGADNVGGVCGYSSVDGDNEFDGNKNESEIRGANNIGGVCGYLTTKYGVSDTYTVSDNTNNGTVTGVGNVGGVVGEAYGNFYVDWTDKIGYLEFSVFTNTAEVVASGDNVGGLIGKGTRVNVISSSENLADVTGGNYVGGWIGNSENTNIKAAGATNNNTVTGRAYVGGFAGKANIIESATNNGTIISKAPIVEDGESKAYVGGIAGYCKGIINCVNNADINVTTMGAYVGGLAGYICVEELNAVKNNENNGVIKGNDCVGGIAGYLTSKLGVSATYTVSGNTNKNTVNGTNNVGGIFGEVYGSFYDDWTDKIGYFEISVLENIAEISANGDNVGGLIGKGTRVSVLSASENLADVTGGNYVGGWVGYSSNTNIKATGFANINTITGKAYVGGIAGYTGIIENATNSGTVIAKSPIIDEGTSKLYLGGIAGYCKGAIGCTNNNDISANALGIYVGGIAGYVCVEDNDRLNNNTNYATVKGNDCVGGIAGYVTMPSQINATYAITGNTNNGTISGAANVGGVFGEVYGAYVYYYGNCYGYFEINSCKNTAKVSASGDNAGGIFGKGTRVTRITACENHADITGANYVGGFVGYSPDTNIKANGFENVNTITGKGNVGGFAGYAGVIENAVNDGKIVSTAVLIEDGVGKAYVGGIAGYCKGLISCTNNADVTVNTLGLYVGGLAGYVYVEDSNRLDNNANYGAVTGKECVGGIAGYVTMPSQINATYAITGNTNNGTISGTTNVGGVFGEVYGTYVYYYGNCYGYFEINSCKNTAKVSASGDNAGGIFGKGTRVTRISSCENSADITGGKNVGGFVGYSPDTNIKANGFENVNTITGKGNVGGFAGYAGVIENAVNEGKIVSTGTFVEGSKVFANVGGIAGYCKGLVSCTNNANISVNGSGINVGGLAGYVYIEADNNLNGNINNGTVKGYDNVGGIAGYVECYQKNYTYQIASNQNNNTVNGNKNVGGIFGYIYGYSNSYFSVTYCSNSSPIKGSTYVGGIIGCYANLKTDSALIETNTTKYGNILGK